MLIEFSVANFRSVVERQAFSMVAGSSRSAKGSQSHDTKISSIPRLLKSAAILGPNGAGKSTIVSAIDFMREFVVASAENSQEGEEIGVEPFLFSRKTKEAPSEFEMIFVENKTRYQYGFTATKAMVTSEWLYATRPGGRTHPLFRRHYDQKLKEQVITINPSIRGEKDVWKKSTRDNALLLSVAVQLKAVAFLEPFNWFRRRLRVIKSSQRLSEVYSAHIAKGNQKERILDFMRSVDINIADVIVSEREFGEVFQGLPKSLRDSILKSFGDDLEGRKIPEVSLGHFADDGEIVYLPLSDESEGTKVLFALAGPWLDVLENGYVLVVDELHNSLHPLAFEMLLDIFQDSDWNGKFGQIIFTTHETHFLARDLVHRDGIWFVKLEGLSGTKLTPLSEFKARPGEAFDRGYLGGRYGSIPRVRLPLHSKVIKQKISTRAQRESAN